MVLLEDGLVQGHSTVRPAATRSEMRNTSLRRWDQKAAEEPWLATDLFAFIDPVKSLFRTFHAGARSSSSFGVAGAIPARSQREGMALAGRRSQRFTKSLEFIRGCVGFLG